MIEALLTYVEQNWKALFGKTPKPQRMSFLLQSRSRVIVFIFANGSPSPVIVAKISRNKHMASQAQHEYDNLTRLHAQIGAEVGDTIPRPIALERVGGYMVMLEPYHTGELMAVSSGRNAMHEFERNIQAVFEWLVGFQREASCGSLLLDRETIEAEIITPIVECYRQTGRDAGGMQLDHWRKLALPLEGIMLPRVYMQGDLSNSNILLSNGKVAAVVDWEFSSPGAWPFYDFFQFLFEYGIEWYKKDYPSHTRWEIVESTVRDMFLRDTPLAKVVQCWLIRFVQEHGLPEQGMPLYFMRYIWDLHWPDNKATLKNLILDGVEARGGIFAML